MDYTIAICNSCGQEMRPTDYMKRKNDEIERLTKQRDTLAEEVARLKEQSANRLIGLCKCGIERDELVAALQRILSTVPALADGGGFVVDHRSPDGEYIGLQNIDPMWVVQEMAAIAQSALTKWKEKK